MFTYIVFCTNPEWNVYRYAPKYLLSYCVNVPEQLICSTFKIVVNLINVSGYLPIGANTTLKSKVFDTVATPSDIYFHLQHFNWKIRKIYFLFPFLIYIYNSYTLWFSLSAFRKNWGKLVPIALLTFRLFVRLFGNCYWGFHNLKNSDRLRAEALFKHKVLVDHHRSIFRKAVSRSKLGATWNLIRIHSKPMYKFGEKMIAIEEEELL